MVAALLEAGHAVAAMDRDAAALDGLRALHPDQPRLHALCADLGTEAGCAGTIADTLAHFGRIDALVNNAGIGVSSLRPDAETRLPAIKELDAATWDRFFAINLRAPMLLLRGALPHMRAAGWGRVVNNTTSFRTMLRGAAVWRDQGGARIRLRDLGAGARGQRHHRQRADPRRADRHAFISDATGWDRAAMLKPAIMGPPLAWLLSDAADGFTGQRIIAARWSEATPAHRAIGWPELGADAVWLQGS